MIAYYLFTVYHFIIQNNASHWPLPQHETLGHTLDSALTRTSLAVGERWSSFLCLPVTLGTPTKNKEKTINNKTKTIISHLSLKVEKSIQKDIFFYFLKIFIFFLNKYIMLSNSIGLRKNLIWYEIKTHDTKSFFTINARKLWKNLKHVRRCAHS